MPDLAVTATAAPLITSPASAKGQTARAVSASPDSIAPARLTLAQYHSMIAAGIIGEDDRLELIDGYLVEKMAIDPPHAVAVYRTAESLRSVAAQHKQLVFQERPLSMPGLSESEPDVMLVNAKEDLYLSGHPTPADVTLLIEVADESLGRDRAVKKPIYAAAGVAEYWILNLKDRQLERYRDPAPPRPEIGEPATYAEATVFAAGATLADERFGQVNIADLLPPSIPPTTP